MLNMSCELRVDDGLEMVTMVLVVCGSDLTDFNVRTIENDATERDFVDSVATLCSVI